MRSSVVRFCVLLLVWGCLASARVGAEVEDDLAGAGAPSLGIYQVTYLGTALNKDPDLTRGYQDLVDFHFESAIRHLQTCIEKNATHPLVASEASTYLGYSYMNLRQPEATLTALETATRLNPKNAVAHFFLAQEYFIENKRDLEKDHLKIAVRIRPDFISALRMLAETDKEDGRGRDAIVLFNQIITYLPNSGYYRYQIYQACKDASEYSQAEQSLKELMRIEPAFDINHWRLGDVYLAENRLDDAEKEYALLRSTPAFKYLADTGYAKVAEKRGHLDEALKFAQLGDDESRHSFEDATVVLHTIEVEQREESLARTHRVVSVCAAVLVVVLLIALIVFYARAAGRRKYVLSRIHKLNEDVTRYHEQDDLCAYLLSFFCPLLGSDHGVVLLHNRFTNQLVTTALRGEGSELSHLKIVTSGDLATWSEAARRPILRVADLLLQPDFERAFPSLAGRLQRAGIEWLLILRERDFFLGLIAVGTSSTRAPRPGSDLLNPLLRTAAKSLEAVILYETSMVDETTGLYNKRYFKQALATELKRADRYQQPCTLITFDLDDFKKINDTYGHSQGDLVLKGMGDILRRNIREGIDTVARTGGEEFHILLPATPSDKATTLAERVRSSVEEHRFEGFAKPTRVTISLGVATYPTHATDEPTLMSVVDAAQYRAKRLGKNRVVVVEKKDGEKSADAGFVPMIESRIDNLNILDAATGLFNFTYFSMRLREEFRRSGRYPTPVSLVVLHIDGDHEDAARIVLLKHLGVVIKVSLREGIDVPTRLETGELAIMVPETAPEAVSKLAARLMELAASQSFPPHHRGLTLSVGISGYPSLASQENELLDAAVQAARRVHSMGGNGIQIAPSRVTHDDVEPDTQEETPVSS